MLSAAECWYLPALLELELQELVPKLSLMPDVVPHVKLIWR